MSKRGSRKPPAPAPTKADEHSIRRQFDALQRVTNIAAAAGADTEDIALAKSWPLHWAAAVIKANEPTPLAEIGRKVSNSREKEDSSDRIERDIQILWQAIQMLSNGAPTRGLAARIRSELKLDISERQINRILDNGMPILLKT